MEDLLQKIDIENLGTLNSTIEDYQAVGFDMDHTLARYKLKNLLPLLYKAMSLTLVHKKSYPQEIFLTEQEEHTYYGFITKATFDTKTGYLLKLGKD